MDEIWKKIELCEKNYYISNMGKIKSNNKILKTHKSTGGYLNISVWKNNKVKHIKIHRLVAQAFIPNPENKPEVNHIDRDRTNNNVENLEWCTHKENIEHMYSDEENDPVRFFISIFLFLSIFLRCRVLKDAP